MAAMLTLTATAEAEVKVAEAFSSHMVLQREKPVSVWGVADAGEKVKVSFGKQTLSTTADNDGLWRVTLKAMPANSKPQVMSISGRKNKIRLTDVLVGEVWLASGQSNMEYSMNNHPRYRKPHKGDADYQLKAWREANNPNIRVLYVKPDLNSDVERLSPIEGLPPNPADLPRGCAFNPRCPYATDACRKEHIPLQDIGEGHLCRCCRLAEIAKEKEGEK